MKYSYTCMFLLSTILIDIGNNMEDLTANFVSPSALQEDYII